MNHEGLDQLIRTWCVHELGPGTLEPIAPADGGQMSRTFRFETAAQVSIAVKVRDASPARIDGCLKVQQLAADSGLPCARPVTAVQTLANGLVVSGEEWRPGGEIMTGDGPEQASRSGALLARLMKALEPCSPEGLGPPPPWMHWNSTGGNLWPPNEIPLTGWIRRWSRRGSVRWRNECPNGCERPCCRTSSGMVTGRPRTSGGRGTAHGRSTTGTVWWAFRKPQLLEPHPAPLQAPAPLRSHRSAAQRRSSAPTNRPATGPSATTSGKWPRRQACGRPSTTPEGNTSSNPPRSQHTRSPPRPRNAWHWHTPDGGK